MAAKAVIPAILLAAGLAAGLTGLGVWQGGAGERPHSPVPISSVFEASEAFEFEPPAPGSYRLHRIKPAPDGEVLDIHGKRRSLHDITAGKISLVSFVYLNCGDVNGCPLAMGTLFDIHDKSLEVPALRGKVQLLTISFDPARDTVEAINAFAYPITTAAQADRKLEWQVLTTRGQDALKPILESYGQVVDRSEDTEQISHLLRIYLIDSHGQIRNIYGLGLIDPRLLMTDVETLLMEEGAL